MLTCRGAQLFMMLLLSVLVGAKGEITPKDYTMPDGTNLTFGNVSTFVDSGVADVTDLQLDEYIPGNLLATDSATLRTVNSGGSSIVVGQHPHSGYVNGYGTDARVSYPAVCQLTPEILLLAEYYSHCVRILNRTDNNYVSDFVGNCTTDEDNGGYADGVGTAARFWYPTRLLKHPEDPNLVFLSEDDGNIRLINVTTRTVTTYLYKGFSAVSSIVWDPYYCNVMLITSGYSFKRLEIDTFTLTTYGSTGGYLDGSLDVGQYRNLYYGKAIYKDLYAVADYVDNRVRIIDTANCVVSSICSGNATATDGSLDQCSVYSASALLYTSGVLYIGGFGYIKSLPINIDLSGSSGSTTTQQPSCATISTEGTRNVSSFTDEASCPQPPTSTTSTSTTTTSTTSTTSTSTTSASTTSTSTTSTTTISTTTTPTATTGSSSSGYICAYGPPDDFERKTCVEGCFGLYKDGQSMVGCMADLDLADNGFADTSTCGTKEQNGYCNKVSTADGEVENCIRCCTSRDICNCDYEYKCDYGATEEGCSSCALRVSNVLVLLIAMVISLYTP